MQTIHGCKALLVDDSATTRALVGELLRHQKIELQTASTAAAGRKALAEGGYDLVLLDYRLPDGDGIDLLREVRVRCDHTAVVIITGKGELDTPVDAIAEGADGYLDKAYLKEGPCALRSALEKALANRRSAQREEELRCLKDEIRTLLVHDLRSPAACASMALQSFRRSSNEEALDLATRALERLFSRLDKYLDFIRIEDGEFPLHKEETCFRNLVEDVMLGATPPAQEKGQKLRLLCELEECPAFFDWDWMSRAVENLLSNAVKYSPDGSVIELEVIAGEQCVLSVRDQGAGIDEKEQARIFERFFRSSRTSDEARGTGLGLLIVSRVMEAHGGTVRVSSRAGDAGGSEFTISFPAVES